MSQDVFQLVQVTADMTQFNEYLAHRRRALKGQAEALEQQRRAILVEVAWIEKATGPKIVKQENSPP
jgi:hypothetical protein